MAIQNYTKRLTAAILDLVQPEVETFDPPTQKPCHRTKRKVNRMTLCRIWPFENFQDDGTTILDLVRPEVGPFDLPTSKTLPP